MSLENDLFGGKGIFSISGSNGITTFGQVVDIKYNTKAKSSLTLDGDPFTFFEQHKLSCRFVETGQDIVDILEEVVDSKNTYFILGSPSVIFKDSRFKPSIDRNWKRDGKFNSITLETSTNVGGNVTASIRNLLGVSGSCQNSVGGLAPGLSQSGAFGITTNIQTGSNFLLTSSIQNGQRLEHTTSVAGQEITSYTWTTEFPCIGDIPLAFEYDVIAISSSGLDTFVGLYDVDDNLIISSSVNNSIDSGSQARIEYRTYWRGVTTQVRFLKCGFIMSGTLDVFLDNFMLEWGRASSFVPR